MRPSSGVDFIAWVSRCVTICESRISSPSTVPTDGSSVVSIVIFLRVAASATASRAASMAGVTRTGSRAISSVPVRIRERSSTSSMSWVCTRALRSIASRARAVASRSSMVPRSIRAHPAMAVSGVRSSCESIARNSSLERFAASASTRAARSLASSWTSSSRVCSVMPARYRRSWTPPRGNIFPTGARGATSAQTDFGRSPASVIRCMSRRCPG